MVSGFAHAPLSKCEWHARLYLHEGALVGCAVLSLLASQLALKPYLHFQLDPLLLVYRQVRRGAEGVLTAVLAAADVPRRVCE